MQTFIGKKKQRKLYLQYVRNSPNERRKIKTYIFKNTATRTFEFCVACSQLHAMLCYPFHSVFHRIISEESESINLLLMTSKGEMFLNTKLRVRPLLVLTFCKKKKIHFMLEKSCFNFFPYAGAIYKDIELKPIIVEESYLFAWQCHCIPWNSEFTSAQQLKCQASY